VASSKIRIRGSARDSLPLAARKFHAALSDHRVIFIGKRLGKLIHTRDAAGAHDFFFTGVRPREGHILTNGPIEQERLLQDDAQPRAIRVEPHSAQVHAVYSDHALRGHIEGRNQADRGGFSRA
jgi:hypothetical protein